MKRQIRRVGVGIGGGLLLLIGIIAIPYPGPGWLIVFAALAILATEFEWARRVLHYAKGKYDRWQSWVKDQSLIVRALLLVFTTVIVVLTLWLVNGYGIMDSVLRLNMPWLHSPLPIFS